MTEQPPQAKGTAAGLHEQETSIVVAQRNTKVNPYLVGALLALVILSAAYFAAPVSAPRTPGSEPHLPAAPRKLAPELKPELQPEFKTDPKLLHPDLLVPVDSPPLPADAVQMLQQQLDLQRTEKARQLREARLKSALDPSDSSGTAGASLLPALNLPPLKPTPSQALTGAVLKDKNSGFALTASNQGVPASQAAAITDPEHKILQGKIIEAIILPRIISDLPGTICALTQRDVYAERGRSVLIPWGSRLCGVYNAELRKGQDRLFTIWNTLRVANADGRLSEVALDSVGSDQLGSARTGGLVDTHFAEIFGTSALLSIIGAGSADFAITAGSTDYQNYAALQYRLSVQQAAAQTAQSVLAPYVNIPPTVTVAAGTRIRIFVNRDLDFSALFQSERQTGKARGAADLFE